MKLWEENTEAAQLLISYVSEETNSVFTWRCGTVVSAPLGVLPPLFLQRFISMVVRIFQGFNQITTMVDQDITVEEKEENTPSLKA